MWSKSAVTQHILLSLPESERPTFDQASQTWWLNSKSLGGMRLTRQGYEALLACELESFVYDIPAGLERIARNLLVLDRKLTCPYFIELRRSPQIVLFGSQQATMLSLYGDFDKWLTYLQRT